MNIIYKFHPPIYEVETPVGTGLVESYVPGATYNVEFPDGTIQTFKMEEVRFLKDEVLFRTMATSPHLETHANVTPT